jgi:glutamine kinase
MSSNNSSKAKILLYLESKVTLFKIPKLLNFNVSVLKKNFSIIFNKIQSTFKDSMIVLRSSASDEDGKFNSAAGTYDSVLNVPANNQDNILAAMDTVIASYEKKRSILKGDQVIIQKMVQNVNMSGVIFTHDLNTGAPYYVINYDDQSGLTNTVTSGSGQYSNRTLYVHRNKTNKIRSVRFLKLLKAVKELEKVMNNKFLDIEFVLDKDLTPFLLQVRIITTKTKWNLVDNKKVNEALEAVDSLVSQRFKRLKNVYGKTTVLGQMPDWNPVEMIGRTPRALSLSLYQTLITDHAWSSAREIMGYAIPKDQSLMVTLAGQPFIDTRLSFHSFLPSSTSPETSEKIVNHWLKHLSNSPQLHDKVEFDIAITAYSFDIDKRIQNLIGDSLNEEEKEDFKKVHLEQTRRLIKGEDKGSINNAMSKIEILNKKQLKNKDNKILFDISLLPKMMLDCIQFGTIPFAILARHGFIAITILHSLQNVGIITKEESESFMKSIQTVASDLVNDINALQLGKLKKTQFQERYGHLRPGTYDIMSLRYDQMIGLSEGGPLELPKHKKKIFSFSKEQNQKIDMLLKKNGFNVFKVKDLENYIREAIIGREYSKFVFTRSISDMLELIANFAKKNKLSKEQISHVSLNSILNIVKDTSRKNIRDKLLKVYKDEEEKHKISNIIRLPQVLVDTAGVYVVPFQVSRPNFITEKKVTAEILIIQSEISGPSLNGKIIVIEGADPGFDWIFSQKIAGLITKYGGVNSHMAIRCAEFGLPAAIGCGEQRYEKIIRSKKINLDCANDMINIIH